MKMNKIEMIVTLEQIARNYIRSHYAIEVSARVEPIGLWVSAGSKKADGSPRDAVGINTSQKQRSKTFPGIARAMAEQWTKEYQIQQSLF